MSVDAGETCDALFDLLDLMGRVTMRNWSHLKPGFLTESLLAPQRG
jgi:hypothetical protein